MSNKRDNLLEKGYSKEAVNIATRISEIGIAILFITFISVFFIYIQAPFHIVASIALYGAIRAIIFFIS